MSRPFGVFASLCLAALALAACGGGGSSSSTTTTPIAADNVGYVTLVGSGANVGLGMGVVPIDFSTATIGRASTLAHGATYPDAIAIAEKSHTAYVANYATNTVTPVNLRTGRVATPIPAGSGPAGIAITPDEQMAYVTDAGTSPIGDTVTPINLRTKKPLPPITVGAGPQGIAITPNGKTAYVADAGAIVSGQTGAVGKTVTPIDLATSKALTPITVGNGPIAIAITPDGTTAYVTNSYSGSVTPISTTDNTAGTPIAMNGSPQAIAITGDGTAAWVANSPSSVANVSNVTAINVASNTTDLTLTVPKGPSSIAIAADNATAWVVCFGANEIVPIALTGAKPHLESALAIGGGPYALALTTAPAGSIKGRASTATGASGATGTK